MKIVKFLDGTYGIRRSRWLIPGYQYWHHSLHTWCNVNGRVYPGCKTSLEDAKIAYQELKDRGEPV